MQLQDNAPSILDQFNQAGPVSLGEAPNLPDTGATRHKHRPADPLTGVVASLNANRDLNTAHDFDFWLVRDSDLQETSAFDGLHRRVMENRQNFNDFSGNPKVDFTNMGPAEIQFYEDFLGINFKKIGHAIGSAATAVGHAGRSVGLAVAHEARNIAVGGAHAVRDAGKDVEKAGLGIAHAGRAVGLETAHIGRGAGLAVAHGGRAVGKAVAPYWKVIATAVVVVVLCWTGVGIPLAAAIGGAMLTGLDAIKPKDPTLPDDFASGGTGGGGEGGGFPSGDPGELTDDDGDPDSDSNDTAEGMPGNPSAQAQAAQQAQEEAAQLAAQKVQQEAIAQAEHIKKVVFWSTGIVGAVIVYWFILRKL